MINNYGCAEGKLYKIATWLLSGIQMFKFAVEMSKAHTHAHRHTHNLFEAESRNKFHVKS